MFFNLYVRMNAVIIKKSEPDLIEATKYFWKANQVKGV